MVKDERYGGLPDIPAYLPECYVKDGVPQGKLSEKLVHSSKIYPGMTRNIGYMFRRNTIPKTPAALMVWQDGQNHTDREGRARTLNVVDNLIDQKKIPVMILVFISPGMAGEQRMRSIQYDTVDDTYPRFFATNCCRRSMRNTTSAKTPTAGLLPGFHRAASAPSMRRGFSPTSSAACFPSSAVSPASSGSPAEREGGETYPFRVRKDSVRNIRVWMQDGAEDLENNHGSWPLQNIQLANSLKMKGYDFHLSWAVGTHNPAHGWSELPESLTWLWREYDPARTEQIFEIGPEEKNKPYFRVGISNRYSRLTLLQRRHHQLANLHLAVIALNTDWAGFVLMRVVAHRRKPFDHALVDQGLAVQHDCDIAANERDVESLPFARRLAGIHSWRNTAV